MEHIFIKIDKILLPLAADYIAYVRRACDELIALAETGGLEQAELIAHKMKGEGAAFGLDEVSRAGAEIMNFASENDYTSLKSRANALKAYLERVRII